MNYIKIKNEAKELLNKICQRDDFKKDIKVLKITPIIKLHSKINSTIITIENKLDDLDNSVDYLKTLKKEYEKELKGE